MSAELQNISVDFQHLDDVTVAHFVVRDISFLNNVDEVHVQLKEEIETHRPTRLVLDFDRVTYISTAGIRMLLNVLRQLRSHGGELCLSNLSEIIRTTLEITHLTSVFRIFDDRKAALAK
ncbi:MAG: STAS domain-containing protein [Phycisphaerae bacterium]|nr:STAS domain-containing protein [Phycisphaerae bacterium]